MKLDTWTSIAPPLHHVTIVSVRRLASFQEFRLGVFDGGRDSEHRVWDIKGRHIPPPTVFHAGVVYVYLKQNTYVRKFEGTQLAFSYHLVRKRVLRRQSYAVQSAGFSVFTNVYLCVFP